MSMEIDLFLPTRNRINNVIRLMHSAFTRATKSERITLHLYLDDNDPSARAAEGVYKALPHGKQVVFHHGPQLQALGETYNVMAKHSDGEVIVCLGDDVVFDTNGWDCMVEKHFANHPISLYYGDDLLGHEVIAVHPIVSRRHFEILGEIFYVHRADPTDNPDVKDLDEGFGLTDVWLHDVYTRCHQIYYDPTLVMRHVHPNFDPRVKVDATYLRVTPEQQVNPKVLWDILTWRRLKTYALFIHTMSLRQERADRLLREIERMEKERQHVIFTGVA